MTAPAGLTVEERRLDDLVEDQDAEVLAAEAAASKAATAQLQQELTALTTAAIVTWEAAGEDEDHSVLIRALRERLTRMRVVVTKPLLDEFLKAFGLGRMQANAQLGRRPVKVRRVMRSDLPGEVVRAAITAEVAVREELDAAARQLAALGRGDDIGDLEAGLARARRSVTRVDQAATWGTGRSVAAGVTAVATEVGAHRLWVGERDACVHCLAYFGEVTGPTSPFPAGLTFGKKPLRLDGPLTGPPLHPHCRCRIAVWDPEWLGAGGGYPEALKREARRSIARGWSLPSESNAQRLDAAERLLRAGAGLPKTVEAYAARAVRTGRFPRGKRFPD